MESTAGSSTEISPDLIIDAMFAGRKLAAIRAAIELDVVTLLGDGRTAASLAGALGASERGVRILCDTMVVHGFLTKTGDRYFPTPSTKVFLDRNSPAYIGAAIEFIEAPEMHAQVQGDPAGYVRKGGAAGLANLSPDNPVWVKFARAMGSFTGGSAMVLAAELAGSLSSPPRKVLDIAAGPGKFGIEIAKTFPSAEIVAVDWKSVLELAKGNAEAAGVGERYRTVAGSAFDVDWGGDFDLVLLPNFLHHFDLDTCASLLRKAKAGLSASGRVVAVDFVPNEDRVSPPFPAAFSWEMLASTPAGEAFTGNDLAEMGRRAGFKDVTIRPLPPSPASVIYFE